MVLPCPRHYYYGHVMVLHFLWQDMLKADEPPSSLALLACPTEHGVRSLEQGVL